MRSKLILLLLILGLFLLTGCESKNNSPISAAVIDLKPLVSEDSNKNSQQKTFNVEEVAKHNSKESCYTIIDNKVYDLTDWINKHPGGAENILKICGKDGTSAFRNQHDNNIKQVNILENFFVGNLINGPARI